MDSETSPVEQEQPELRAAVLATSRSILVAQQRAERDLLAAREALLERNAALAAANSILEATLNATPVGVLVARRDGTVALRNRRFDELWSLERPKDQPLSLDGVLPALHRLLVAPDVFLQWTQQVRQAPEQEHALQCRTTDGRHLRCQAMPQRQGGATVGVVYNWLDITEQVQAEGLRSEVQAAAIAAKAKTAFISRASHELRTPLNAVLGFSQLLERHPTVIADAGISRQVGHIHTAGEHLRALMDDLLTISQLEIGATVLHPLPLDLAALLHDTLALMALLAEERGISVVNTVPATAWVLGDATRVRQVLMNLLSNAIKYNRAQGCLTLRLLDRDSHLALEIADTGRGMSQDQVDHLFEPFNRLGAERSSTQGTGLGLVITRQLLLAMQGDLHVASVPGEGSAFTVVLPKSTAAG